MIVMLAMLINVAIAAPTVEMQINQGSYSTGDRMNEFSVRAQMSLPGKGHVGLDTGTKNAFGDSSNVISPFVTLDLHEHWYATGSLLFSDQGALYPTRQIFAELFHKIGPRRDWVVGLGGGSTQYSGNGREQFATADLIYYAKTWLVLQGGLRHIQSQPSQRQFQRYYSAATLLWAQRTLLIRYERGREAYALLGTSGYQEVFDFESHVYNAALTTPLSKEWGLRVSAEYYQSHAISKTGGGLSVIHQF